MNCQHSVVFLLERGGDLKAFLEGFGSIADSMLGSFGCFAAIVGSSEHKPK